MKAATEPLTGTFENTVGWKSAQKDPNEPGSAQLVVEIDDYVRGCMSTANIYYVESYPPLFDAHRNEMVVHVKSDAGVFSMAKFNQDKIKNYGKRVSAEKLFRDMTNPTEQWSNVAEKITLPTKFHWLNESLCKDVPVTMVVSAYNGGYGKFAPLDRNPRY